MADLAFGTPDYTANDSALTITQKIAVAWRACAIAAPDFSGGGGSGFVGQEWDTDANAPTQDTDANASVKDTDTA